MVARKLRFLWLVSNTRKNSTATLIASHTVALCAGCTNFHGLYVCLVHFSLEKFFLAKGLTSSEKLVML